MTDAERTTLARLVRARDAAIAHLMGHDPAGALGALLLARDAPHLFDRCTFQGEPAYGTPPPHPHPEVSP